MGSVRGPPVMSPVHVGTAQRPPSSTWSLTFSFLFKVVLSQQPSGRQGGPGASARTPESCVWWLRFSCCPGHRTAPVQCCWMRERHGRAAPWALKDVGQSSPLLSDWPNTPPRTPRSGDGDLGHRERHVAQDQVSVTCQGWARELRPLGGTSSSMAEGWLQGGLVGPLVLAWVSSLSLGTLPPPSDAPDLLGGANVTPLCHFSSRSCPPVLGVPGRRALFPEWWWGAVFLLSQGWVGAVGPREARERRRPRVRAQGRELVQSSLDMCASPRCGAASAQRVAGTGRGVRSGEREVTSTLACRAWLGTRVSPRCPHPRVFSRVSCPTTLAPCTRKLNAHRAAVCVGGPAGQAATPCRDQLIPRRGWGAEGPAPGC